MDGTTTTLYQTDLRYRYKTGIIRGNNTDHKHLDRRRTRKKIRLYLGIWNAFENLTKEEFNTDPDTINTERLLQLFKDCYMPKRNKYNSSEDFFWAKQEENETPEEHGRKLVSLEKNCEFKDIKQEDLPFTKFITSITNKNVREELIREKTLNLKTRMDLVTQDNYEKRHKQPIIHTELVK